MWLVDAKWTYQFRTPPLLRLEHANFPLPCQEVLWEAESSVQWQHMFEYSPQSLTLIDAIHSIYVHKRLQPTMGGFIRIILIHGLYHRNWEVGDYLKEPLSAWLPGASRPGPEPVPQVQVWLPQDPIFSRWRNASCDCLDILHWSANSVIGAASGLEHPTVLHLHLARVILLTPIRDIRRLALMVTEGAQRTAESEFSEQQQTVRKWAREDAYKARLAIIHAGALLWHVHRYSAKGFHEGSAVFMATLALWAYGRFGMIMSKARSNEVCNDEDEDHPEENPCPIAINLDRPADDELVQTFIKKGHSMQALLNGVGEIHSPHGPKRVLREGLKIITRSGRWASNCNLASLMERLEKLEP